MRTYGRIDHTRHAVLACFGGAYYLQMLSGAKLAPEPETEKASHDVAVHQTLDTFQAKNHGAFPL